MGETTFGSGDLERSVRRANELLDASETDETTSDDPHLTASRSEADRKARFYAKARETRDRLNTLLSDLGQKADDAQRRVRENAEESFREGVRRTERKIREKPLAAVGIAAGIGLVVGLLLSRR